MATYNHNSVKNGLKILIDNDPHTIVSCDFVKPGKGQAFTRVKVRNLLNGRVVEKTYKASDTLEGADVLETNMQYLYTDGESWNFMDPSTYEQVAADATAMGDTALWVKEEDECTITLWNGQPIQVQAPNFVVREVVETDPGLKGDTSSGGSKPAKVESGGTVKVPLFIQEGELIRIDTRTGDYMSRAKE